jgi:hypothetical protein
MMNNLIFQFTEKNISKLVNYICFTHDKKCKKQVQAKCGNMCIYLLLPCFKQMQIDQTPDKQCVSCVLSDA